MFRIFLTAGFIILSIFVCCNRPLQEHNIKKTASGQVAKKDSVKHRFLSDAYIKEKGQLLDNFFTKMASLKKFNGNVLVAKHGEIIYQNSFGIADYQTKEPLQINSAFQLASVSKQFTASAIMLLKDRGLIDYNDTIQKFFPDFPYKNITIKMLLTHRSGLPNYMYFCDHYRDNRVTPISNMGVIDLMTEKRPDAYFYPNKHFSYSNTNYCVLAAIVEKISGKSFGQFMKSEIFDPLEMNNTWVYDLLNDTVSCHRTKGYESNWKFSGIDYLDGVTGDKGVYSTVEDLLKWDQALYSGELIKKSTIEEAFIPTGKKKSLKNYGFGWRIIGSDNEDKIVYHNGWWRGYNTSFVRRLSDETTIIILGNRHTRNIYDIKTILSLLGSPADELEMENEG